MISIEQLTVHISTEGYKFSITDGDGTTNILQIINDLHSLEVNASLRSTTQVLRQLIDEELAFLQDHYVVVPHETIAELHF